MPSPPSTGACSPSPHLYAGGAAQAAPTGGPRAAGGAGRGGARRPRGIDPGPRDREGARPRPARAACEKRGMRAYGTITLPTIHGWTMQ